MIAAAGIAEAAWTLALILIGSGLLLTGIMALVAAAWPSRGLVVAAVGLLVVGSLYFEVWRCFTPFEAVAYEDPDVVSAAASFRAVGVAWVVTCVFILGCAARLGGVACVVGS